MIGNATGTLTSNNTNVSNNDTVTIGSKTYTFKTSLTPTEGEVLIGADADASLLNLIRAINHSGTPDTDYKCAAANTQVTAATSVTSHSFAVTAISSGLVGNSIATTETAATLSWSGLTLSGGEAITITGEVSDETFTSPGQRITIGQFPESNPSWSRVVRLTDEALFCLRSGENPVAMMLDCWATIAHNIETGLSWSPFFSTQPSDATCAGDTAASGTITSDNTNVSDNIAATATLTSDNTNVSAGVAATATLTSDTTNVSNGDTVTIGNKTYTFKTSLTATEGEVLIGADADASLLNLIRAINHSGTPGTDYNCASAHTQVSAATSVISNAFLITALTSGTSANSYATTETSSHLSFGGATMSGGVDTATVTIGSKTYTFVSALTSVEGQVLIGADADTSLLNLIRAINHSGTFGTHHYCAAANTQVSAATSVSSHAFAITALTAGSTGNSIVTTETSSHLSWGSGTMTGGADAATVTIGSKTYTFKSALTPTEGEVLIGADADASLLNLIRAINHTGTPDTDYKCAAAHTQVTADSSVTSHAFAVTAIESGVSGNSVTTTETSGHLSWGAATLTGGTCSASSMTIAVSSELSTTYQWQYSSDGETWSSATGTIGGTVYTNDTTTTLGIAPTTLGHDGYYHRCVATNAKGSTNSDTATLTIE